MTAYEARDISLVITTHQSPDRLRWVLESVSWQDQKPLEVIVADDGSDPNTRNVVLQYQKHLSVRLLHSWQPDSSFRLARSRNLALSKARGSWMVFIDGDCVMPPDFVSSQCSVANDSCLVFGSRKLLGELDTKELLLGQPSLSRLNHYLTGRKFWKLPVGPFRTWPRRTWRNVKGFMMAASRRDFLAIGGFDESFDSWGLEDSDFAVRASRFGLKFLDSKYKTSLVHLYHPEPNKIQKSKNDGAFRSLLSEPNRFLPSNTSIPEASVS